MIIYAIILFWILIKLGAPAWCFALVGLNVFSQLCKIIQAVIDVRAKRETEEKIKRDELLKNLGGN